MQVKYVTMLFVSLAWASSYVLAKIIFLEIEPMTFTAARYLIALLILSLFVKKRVNLSKNLLIVGGFGFALAPLLQYLGLWYTTSIDTTLILSANPSIAALLSYIIMREKIKIMKIIGIFLAFFGVVFIVFSNIKLGVFSFERIFGDFLVFLSGVFWVVSSIYGKKSLQHENPSSLTYSSMAIGVPIMLFSALFFESFEKIFQMSFFSWVLLLTISIVNTSIAFFLWFRVLKEISATEANLFLNTIPIWTAALAIPILGESLTPQKILGAILVFFGVYLAQKK
ncbi:MAG: DMT family transporter [Candidatus Methanofastidiosia archaeon]